MSRTWLAAAAIVVIAAGAWLGLRNRRPMEDIPAKVAIPPPVPLASARSVASQGTATEPRRPLSTAGEGGGEGKTPNSATAPEPSPYPSPARGRGSITATANDTDSRVAILEDVLRSHNDNDPRLDREFNDLTPEAKAALRSKYQSLPQERRNDRGTIVYLLGRNLRTAEDWAFLRRVVAEPPCLSMADCSMASAPEADKEEHANIEVTLVYPQLVALKQAERALASKSSREARGVIEAAKASPSELVAKAAAELPAQF